MDNNIYIFLHITLVTSLSTADWMALISQDLIIFTPTTIGISYVAMAPTVTLLLRIIIQTLDNNSCYTIIQPLVKQKLPISCLDDVLKEII